VAHPPPGRRRLIAALALAAAVHGAPPARALDVRLEPYRTAAESNALGSISGRAYEERKKPTLPDQPVEGAAVTLLPRSAEFLARLETLRARSRDSERTYLRTVSEVRRTRDDYEQGVWEAGGADLVRGAVTDADGRFAFTEVPAGQWIVFAYRSLFVPKAGQQPGRKQRSIFAPTPRLEGFQTVSLWVVDTAVSGGETKVIELTDRNVWLTGIVEETRLDTGR
jgi:hypothetical protein